MLETGTFPGGAAQAVADGDRPPPRGFGGARIGRSSWRNAAPWPAVEGGCDLSTIGQAFQGVKRMFDTSSPGKQNDTFIELNLKTCPKIVSQVRKSQTRSKKARAREREEMKGRKKKNK
uniref:Uncharacterized protein n=1 Tax=Oryza rufipogon TaxID=4529 RepID=A0A0E0NMH6_ORYRU